MSKLSHHLSFDAPQRRVLGVLLAALIGYGVVRRLFNPVYIDDPPPAAGDRSTDLADRLDPNTATAADLAALPGLGDKRAEAIVAWRNTALARYPATLPYRSSDDLYYVSGFRRAMVDQAAPFLLFPATQITQDKSRTTP